MFVVIYQWKLKAGSDAEFREAWRQATQAIYEKRGSLGSQLMQSKDGIYHAVAKWQERDQWVNRSQPEAPRAWGHRRHAGIGALFLTGLDQSGSD